VTEPRRPVTAATRIAGVIGWPVDHSLSPAIHNAAFRALDLDWVYVALAVRPGAMPRAVQGLTALGFEGANVTMPHKDAAADLADDLSEDARLLHAVNTLIVTEDGVVGENTDAPGFERFMQRDAGFDPAGRRALVFGAGGAARACALALARGGLAHLTVCVRDASRAQALRDVLARFPIEVETVRFATVAAGAEAHGATPDLVVNATPLGAASGPLPLPIVGSSTVVVDLLYHPSVTPLQSAARAAGATAFGGLGLLLHQAALSFERWTGQVAPLDVMSAAALAELARRA